MYTSHGHLIPNSPVLKGEIPPVFVFLCGGIGECKLCTIEADLTSINTTKKDTKTMEFETFVRKPFLVEAVEVTEENIEEVAEHVGDLQHKPDGTPYIQVNRRLIPNVYRVYPGFWMTKMGDNIRCYSRRVFTESFVKTTLEIHAAIDKIVGIGEEDEGDVAAE